EVFAKYGLTDKAIERLFSLSRRRPDLLKVRERLVELLVETRNPALQREAEALAAAYQDLGRPADAARILGQGGTGEPVEDVAPPPAPAPPAADGDVAFEEFDVEPAVLPPPAAGPATLPEDAIEFGEGDQGGPAPSFQRLSTPEPQAPADSEFV